MDLVVEQNRLAAPRAGFRQGKGKNRAQKGNAKRSMPARERRKCCKVFPNLSVRAKARGRILRVANVSRAGNPGIRLKLTCRFLRHLPENRQGRCGEWGEW